MANPKIKIKRSAIAGKVPHYPDNIGLGEFAINHADGKVFIAAGQAGVGVGTTVIEVGISTARILSGIATVTTLQVTNLTATNQITGISSGAAKVETATDGGNQWHHVAFLDNRTGYQKIKTNGLTYNPSTGKLYAGIGSFHAITGDLTGDVTGDVTGSLTGPVTGEVTGNVTGNVTGDLNGNVTGDLNGNVTGNLTGDVTGNVTGNLTGNVYSTGISTISGFTFPESDGTSGQVLGTDGAGQLAFITASSAGSGTTITNLHWTVGVGSTAFQSPHDIEDRTALVFNNGLKLSLDEDYYIESNTVYIKNGPLDEGDRVHVTIHYDTFYESEFFTATDGQTTFNLAATLLSSQDRAKVYLNGAKLRGTIDYGISQTVNLNIGATEGDLINISADAGESYTSASSGQTAFTYTSSGITASNLIVYQNGIRLEPTDYTVGSLSLVLTQGTEAGDSLDVLLYA